MESSLHRPRGLAAGLIAAALAITPVRAGKHTNADITLLSFGSMQGELVTCGCHASPKGGLARRAAIVDSLRAHGDPFLHLELGDFSDLDHVSGVYQTRFIWQMLERMRVDAIAPGPRELTLWETIDSLRSSSRIPFVASNLEVVHRGRSAPAGRRELVLKVNDRKVALFALLGRPELDSARPPEGVTFALRDPIEAARQLVPKLRKKADVVVLMSQMDPAATERLLQEVPGIDVALCGQRPPWQEQASRVGRSIVNQTGSRGQYAGRVTLIVSPSGEIVDFGSRNLVLDNRVAEDPEVAALVASAEATAKEMRARQREELRAATEKANAAGQGDAKVPGPAPASGGGPATPNERAHAAGEPDATAPAPHTEGNGDVHP